MAIAIGFAVVSAGRMIFLLFMENASKAQTVKNTATRQ
jgi:hypothetical protein